MTTLDPETVDLAAVARALDAAVPAPRREGAVVGRTALRDATARHLGCSDALAERIVDTMVARGFLVFEQPPGAPGVPARWHVGRKD